jgi:PhnB protein
MAAYTDFYVLPVKKARLDAYRRFAQETSKVWLAHGALSVSEYIAEDAKPGVHTSFPQAVKLEDGEIVAVAMLTFRSRAACERIKEAVMKDPVFANMSPDTVPVDGRRMFWGGFETIVAEAAPVAAGVQPYLFFRGRCEEAIAFYQETLGAEVQMMMRFKDNPDHPGHEDVPASLGDRIMHACLRINGADINMSDGMRTGDLDFQCMSLSLTVASEVEADHLFNALARDGAVQMPLGKTFFSPRFGAVSDKFGVSWLVIVPPER